MLREFIYFFAKWQGRGGLQEGVVFSKNDNFGRTLKSFYSLNAARDYLRKNNNFFCRSKTRFSHERCPFSRWTVYCSRERLRGGVSWKHCCINVYLAKLFYNALQNNIRYTASEP